MFSQCGRIPMRGKAYYDNKAKGARLPVLQAKLALYTYLFCY
jgi:hypothetical protein